MFQLLVHHTSFRPTPFYRESRLLYFRYKVLLQQNRDLWFYTELEIPTQEGIKGFSPVNSIIETQNYSRQSTRYSALSRSEDGPTDIFHDFIRVVTQSILCFRTFYVLLVPSCTRRGLLPSDKRKGSGKYVYLKILNQRNSRGVKVSVTGNLRQVLPLPNRTFGGLSGRDTYEKLEYGVGVIDTRTLRTVTVIKKS